MIVEGLALLIGAILFYYLMSRLSEPSSLPPGPRPLPLLGNLLNVIDSIPYVHIALCKLHKKYGDVMTLYLQGQRIVVIGSVTKAREALLTRKDDFAGRPYVFGGDYVTRHSKDIVFGDYSSRLKLLRKIGANALRLFLPQVEKTINIELKELIRRMKTYGDDKVDIKNDIHLSIMNVVCALIFGQRYHIDDPEFYKCVFFTETACRIAESTGILGMFPVLIHLPLKSSNDIKQCCDVKDEILDRKYREHLQTFKDNVTRDLTDALIKVKLDEEKLDSKTADIIEEDHVIMTMQDMFIAGNESSTATLLWSIVHLTSHPQLQAKIHQQIDDVIGYDRTPEIKDKERLPLIEAVLSETSRLSSVVPLSIPHKTTRDTNLGNYIIPHDTTVLVNLWAIHHDEREWEEPMKFKPERFLDSYGKLKDASKMSYMPFSAGRRNCLGEALAKQMMFLLLTGILQQFELVNSPGCDIKLTEGVDGIVRRPENFKLCLRKREKNSIK